MALDMITCAGCGTANEAERKFCGECGESLARPCPNCGTANSATMKFCGECGTDLVTDSDHPAAPVQAERRLVTVLFADLTGFTPFSEDRDPEDVRSLLTDYFDRSREVIERFGGVVDKFIGDAVMAVWGAVTANDDDAERAVRAGLELVDTVAKLASDQGSPELALRVGVLTGEASVGPGGNEKGLVVGDLVNTASRLQSIAEPGTVLVGESTMRASSGGIAFESIGEQTVKGKAVPVAAFRVDQILAEVGGRGRVDVLEPPFVGRTDELRLLKDLRESVGRNRKARHVSIIGEGGIGKSRLAWEFQKYADGLVETTYWHQGRSPAYGDGVAFWAVKEMIHRRAGILEAADDETVIAAVDEALDEFLDPEEADWVRPRLHAVLGVGTAPSGARSELDSAVRLLFQGVANKAPVVMVFEDLQWADPGVLDFVEELTEWSRDYPILVITLARPELLDRRPDWGSTGRMMSVRLGPLTPDELRLLVTGTMPDLADETIDAVVDRSGGVPLFAVELMRGLSEGVIDKTIPESIQAAIGARLDRLPDDHRALAQDAAVLGQTFTLNALIAVTGVTAEDADPILDSLARSELIEPIRDPRSPERGQYRFVQSMIREVASGRLSRDIKRKRHLAAADYLLERDDPELAPVVADHFLQAYNATPEGPESEALRGRALSTLMDALRRAEEVRSYEQILSTGDIALELTESNKERLPIWESMAQAAEHHAQVDRALELATVALEEVRANGSDEDEDRVIALVGEISVLTRREGTVELLSAHLDERGQELSNEHLVHVASKLTHAAIFEAAAEIGLAAADQCLLAAEQRGMWSVFADTLISKGAHLEMSRRHVEARILMEGAVRLADREQLLNSSIRGRINVDYSGTGDPRTAPATLSEALDLARRAGDRSLAHHVLNNLLALGARHGDVEQINAILEDPLQESMSPLSRSFRASMQGQLALLAGDHELAKQMSLTIQDEAKRYPGSMFREVASSLFTGSPQEAFDALGRFGASTPEFYPQSLEQLGAAVAMSGDRDHLDRIVGLADSHPALFKVITQQPRAFVSAIDGDSGPARKVTDEYLSFPWVANAVFTLAGAANFLPDDHADARPMLEEALALAESVGWIGLRDLVVRHVTL